MNDLIVDVLSQLREEWIHATLALIVAGVGGLCTVAWYFYRRNIKRMDEERARIVERVDEHDDRLASHDRQIRDTRTAIAEARIAGGLGSFPYTE